MARPYWSGQIRISLVAFKITLNSALRRGSQVPLHEYDRDSGERIHHRNVTENGDEVDAENIVKGVENGDSYVVIEQDEIDAIKLPSGDTLDLVSFVPHEDIPLARFERPYFVFPDGKGAGDIYAVIHRALRESGKMGIGQIAMRGREELCGVYATENGLMLHTLRYDTEIAPDDELPDLKKKIDKDNLDLASQLIKKNTHPAQFEKFHDHYHEALLELIKAKKAHRKPKLPKAAKQTAHVIDFGEALRKSLGAGKARPGVRKRKKKAA